LFCQNYYFFLQNRQHDNVKGGAQAMLQGAATYACFTYFIDKFFGSPEKELKQRQALLSPELVYNDISLGDGEL